jgi:hypothetical protein
MEDVIITAVKAVEPEPLPEPVKSDSTKTE